MLRADAQGADAARPRPAGAGAGAGAAADPAGADGPSLSLIVRDLPLVVQDLDDSPASRELIDGVPRLADLPHRRLAARPPARRGAASSGAARGVLIIPPSFGRDLARGVDAPVQLLVDGSRRQHRQACSRATPAASRPRSTPGSAGGAAAAPVRPAVRFWYNPERSSKQVLRPGHLRDGAVDVSAAARHAGDGARRRAEDDPAGLRVEHLGARVPARQDRSRSWSSRSPSASLLLGAPVHVLRRRGSPAIRRRSSSATLLYAFCVASFGTMVGAAIPNQAAAMQAVMFGGFLLVFMLSGLMFPLREHPGGAPVDLELRLGALLHRGRARRASCRAAAGPPSGTRSLAIGGIGGVFFTIAWRRMRRMQLEA